MVFGEPSLADKEAFFAELLTLSFDLDSDEDDIDEAEADRSRLSRQALQGASSKDSRSRPSSSTLSASKAQSSPSHPRRTASSPLPAKEPPPLQVIERTPLAEIRSLEKKPSDGTPAVVEETPIPDSTRAPLQPIQLLRSTSTPNPLTRQLRPHRRDQSPSLNATMKKRKREAAVQLVPEEQQVFKNLRFYFIPNDDIAPARRIRIRKAQEYGASWARNLSLASHVIVDKSLSWKSIEPVLASASGANSAIVVNETYPLDCIQFRSVLNPRQKQYLVAGCPVDQASEPPPPAPAGSTAPGASLPLKPPPNNPKRFGYVPPPSTPSQSQQSAGTSEVPLPAAGAQETPVAREKVPGGPDIGNQPRDTPDELADVISQMQEFRDVPSDPEDDDAASIVGTSEAVSDAEDSGDEHSQKKQRSVKPTRRKEIAWEERFACNKGGLKDGDKQNPNARTIEILQHMADYYGRINDTWRPIAYRKVISLLKRQSGKIATAEEAIRLPGVGARLADKIEEIVTTDRLRRLENAERDPADETLQTFVRIYGVGNAQASRWIAQGHRTLDDLRAGARLSANQRVGVDHYDDLNTRIPRREVEALGAVVRATAAELDPRVELIIGGSYRRGSDSSGDIDFIVTRGGTTSAADLLPFLARLTQTLEARGFLVAALATSRDAQGGSKWHGCCVLPESAAAAAGLHRDEGVAYRPVWRRIDFLIVPETERGAALLYFTGNDIFNRSMRLLASRKGMRLNQRGLYRDVMRGPGRAKVTDGELLEGRDERRIFELLNVTWREPHERWC